MRDLTHQIAGQSTAGRVVLRKPIPFKHYLQFARPHHGCYSYYRCSWLLCLMQDGTRLKEGIQSHPGAIQKAATFNQSASYQGPYYVQAVSPKIQ